MNKILFLFFLLIFSVSCNKPKDSITGRYYPNEFREELNLSSLSTLELDNNSLSTGDEADLLIKTFNSSGNPLTYGGALISLFYEGTGAVTFSNFVDNKDGTYSSKVKAIKNGTVLIKARLNPIQSQITIYNTVQTNISIGAISLSKSTITLSAPAVMLNTPLTFTLTVKDSLGNLINDSSLLVYPTLLDGTIEGNFSSVEYIGNAQYRGTFTPTVNGSATKVNLSIRRIGSVLSSSFGTVGN